MHRIPAVFFYKPKYFLSGFSFSGQACCRPLFHILLHSTHLHSRNRLSRTTTAAEPASHTFIFPDRNVLFRIPDCKERADLFAESAVHALFLIKYRRPFFCRSGSDLKLGIHYLFYGRKMIFFSADGSSSIILYTGLFPVIAPQTEFPRHWLPPAETPVHPLQTPLRPHR